MIRGRLSIKGANVTFQLDDLCSAGYPEQKNRFEIAPEAKIETLFASTGKLRLIALVSGLEVHQDFALNYDKLYHFLAGEFGNVETMRLGKSIEQLVIAGNCTPQSADIDKVCRGSFRAEKYNKKVCADLSTAIDMFELYLKKLVSCCKVTIMPGTTQSVDCVGECDVGSILLPQKPLSKCLFEEMAESPRLELATNPCAFDLDGRVMLGTSGQNVNDIMMYSKLSDPIKIMKKQLKWRHVCPTTPDTLRSYPFDDKDPFVLDSCPNLYFVGNQEHYMTKVIKNDKLCIKLLAVPRFALTKSIVLLNMDTLDTFEVSLSQEGSNLS